MDRTGSGLCLLSALALKMFNLCVPVPEYDFYVGSFVVEIADCWNWLRIVFTLGLDTEDVEHLCSATRV